MKLLFWRKSPKKRKHVHLPDFIGFEHDIVPLRKRKYNQDGLATTHSNDFAFEPRFEKAYDAAFATGSWSGTHIHWRAHVICWAAAAASNLEGDFVECGTDRGGTAMLVLVYLQEKILNRQFLLFDTFRGLDKSVSSTKEIERSREAYPDCYEEVVLRFKSYQNIKIVRGVIPMSLEGQIPNKIAYLHIDLNSANVERTAIEALWPSIVDGGIVVLDDYNWTARADQKKSMDEFARMQGIHILSLPTGQGLMIKMNSKDVL